MVKLDNERGSICISSEVFTWLAGDAATRCFGVKGMAGRAKESGLRGIAVHAGNGLIVDEAEVVRLADKEGLFVIGVDPSDYAE
jgi:uncharacterized alkaline shock family protein YloU